MSEALFEVEPSIIQRRLPRRAQARRARAMPLSEFSDEKRREIAEAVALPKPPPRWIHLGPCQIQSRAWHEWYWQRGLDPDGVRSSLSAAVRQAVIERDGMVCGLCRGTVEDVADIHIDHIKPRIHGGSDHLGNLQVAHSWCNLSKGARG